MSGVRRIEDILDTNKKYDINRTKDSKNGGSLLTKATEMIRSQKVCFRIETIYIYYLISTLASFLFREYIVKLESYVNVAILSAEM